MLDFPPVGLVTDSIVICCNITGYLFVVRSNSSDTRKVNETIAEMEKIGAKIVGIVLNAYNPKSTKRYGYERINGKYAKSGSYEKYYNKYAKKSKYGTATKEKAAE